MGDPGNLWIVASEQTQGRGRCGRLWHSPPGNLYASLLLINPAPLALLSQLSFVAGIVLCQAVRHVLLEIWADDSPRICPAVLKWPNDLVYQGAKLGGILIESIELAQGNIACVVGFGVNCWIAPQDTLCPTICLREILLRAPMKETCQNDLEEGVYRSCSVSPPFRKILINETGEGLQRSLLKNLIHLFPDYLKDWQKGSNFNAIREQWLKLAFERGQKISVHRGENRVEGLFHTIDEEGCLVLEEKGQLTKLSIGEVFLENEQ